MCWYVAGKGARGAVLFCDHAEGSNNYLTTGWWRCLPTRMHNSICTAFEETTPQNTRFSTIYVEQQSRSRVSYDGVTLTNGLTRNRMDVRLRGTDAASELYGAVIADGKQQVDNNILVEHLAPRCTSDMLYKYVLNGESRGAFAGKVYVAPGNAAANSFATDECKPLCFDRGTCLFAADA